MNYKQYVVYKPYEDDINKMAEELSYADSSKPTYNDDRLKLFNKAFRYITNNEINDNREYGVDLMEVIQRCIDAYDPSRKTKFTSYLKGAWNTELDHLYGDKKIVEKGNMYLTENEKRTFKKYCQVASRLGIAEDSEEFNVKIAKAMKISEKEVKKLKAFDNIKIEYEIFEDDLKFESYLGDALIDYNSAVEIFDAVEVAYNSCQARQRPLIAALLTTRLALVVKELGDKYIELFKSKSFYDEDIYDEVIARGTRVLDKEIGRRFNRTSQTISPAVKGFLRKVDSRLYANDEEDVSH